MVKLPELDKNPAQDLVVAALPKPSVIHNPFLRVMPTIRLVGRSPVEAVTTGTVLDVSDVGRG